MEAAPRLPMVSFQFKTSTEKVSFGQKLKQYISNFYHEDGESYTNEIYKLESLRAAAVHPSEDISSCQLLKEYYCQLHFLKSRFPMEEGHPCAVYFSWKDSYTHVAYSVPDINFELMCILYNIGALHSQLGTADTRSSSEGMKMSCTHFQCAAWAFQMIRENYQKMFLLHDSYEIIHAMQLISLAQAQECILEKSMLDNRKATIIAKVAVQVVDYYKQALATLEASQDESEFYRKYTLKYLAFKCEYHRCIALLYQGQQSEEQQKMGERVAFYQLALEHLEEARKHASNMSSSQSAPFKEAYSFTLDVVEGKRKAAKNENEFIYHEEVPDKDVLQEIKGASLVKGIPFSVNDIEVSGPDIFARLVPMEAHEASSLYSERKAELLRRVGNSVEVADVRLTEFMSSLQLDVLSQMHQARGLPQDLIDRAAALSARPTACQDLVSVMGKLSNSYHDVEAMLNDIQELLKEEEHKEKEYQAIMGKRPPSIIATDLSREAAKYQEAHGKASESNQNLHRAMTAHVANIKILAMPLMQLQQQIPTIELPNPNVDEKALHDIETLVGKVEEMKSQRGMLLGQLRDAVHQDDITGLLVTRQPDQALDQLFQQGLDKHQQLANVIQQNLTAQDNIFKALVDTYAQFSNSRKYLQDVIGKRNTMLTNLINSYDTYEDLLAKANKGIEFYNKLETNVSKLLQRIKSACKVQDEEREQIMLKNNQLKPEITAQPNINRAPKLKDYLDTMKGDKVSSTPVENLPYQAPVYQPIGTDTQQWPPAIRPAPVGSEINSDMPTTARNENRIDYGSGHMSYGSYGISGQPNNTTNVYTYSSGYNHPISNTGQVGNSQANNQTDNVGYPSNTYNQNTNAAPTINQQHGYSGYSHSQGFTGYPQAHVSPNISTYNQSTTMPSMQNTVGYTVPTTQVTYAQPANYDAYSQNYSPYVNHTGYNQPTVNMQPTTQPAILHTQTKYTPTTQSHGTHSVNQSVQPSNQTEYLQSVTQVDYNNPTVPGGFVQSSAQYTPTTTQINYSQPTTQFNYNQPTGQSAYTNPNYQTGDPQTQYQVDNSQVTNQVNQNKSANATGKTLDETLSERMAALMTNSNKTQTNKYIPSQYSQYDYGSYAYNSANSYSYATNTLPDSSNYQTVSTTNYPYVTTSEQCSNNPNTYNSVSDSVNKTVPYGNTSYGYGSNISSTGYPVGYNFGGHPYKTENTSEPLNQGVSAFNSQGATSFNTQNTADAAQYPTQTGTYSTSYGANTQNLPASSISNQDPSYYYYNPATSQYYTYPEQQTSDGSANNGNYYTYYGNYNTTAVSNQATSTTVTTVSSHSQIQDPSSKVKVESSIDLLTGLDFNINHAPLVPQQKSETITETKEVSSSKSVELPQIANTKVTLKPEEKTQEIPNEKSKTEIPKVDPFQNADTVKQFAQEVDKFEKFCDSLITKTLNGPTTLDLKWKEIQDRQDNECYNRSISVARCYPLKNRFPDILPYDYSRVELKTAKDDYINASIVKDASKNCPLFIVTQAPTASTFPDFWTMIWEQDIGIIVCLLSNNELGNDIYWAKEIGKDLTMTDKVISLISTTTKDHWIERRISISIPEKRKVKTLLHLQYTSWPGSLFPTSPFGFVNFTKEALTQYDQLNMSHPLLVHCSAGVGRSGLFCTLLTAVLEVLINPSVLPDVTLIGGKMSCKRKNILRDREHLKFCYIAFLYYLKELQNRYVKQETASGHSRKASTSSLNIPPVIEDPLSTLDPLWATKRNN